MVVGILFLVIGGLNINDEKQHVTADVLNNVIVIMIFVISVINVVLNSFGIEHQNINPAGTVFNVTSPIK